MSLTGNQKEFVVSWGLFQILVSSKVVMVLFWYLHVIFFCKLYLSMKCVSVYFQNDHVCTFVSVLSSRSGIINILGKEILIILEHIEISTRWGETQPREYSEVNLCYCWWRLEDWRAASCESIQVSFTVGLKYLSSLFLQYFYRFSYCFWLIVFSDARADLNQLALVLWEVFNGFNEGLVKPEAPGKIPKRWTYFFLLNFIALKYFAVTVAYNYFRFFVANNAYCFRLHDLYKKIAMPAAARLSVAELVRGNFFVWWNMKENIYCLSPVLFRAANGQWFPEEQVRRYLAIPGGVSIEG